MAWEIKKVSGDPGELPFTPPEPEPEPPQPGGGGGGVHSEQRARGGGKGGYTPSIWRR